MTTPQSAAHPRRKRLLLLLILVFLLVAVFYGGHWWLHGRHYVSTDDAYVAGNLIRVTPRIAGTVTQVRVDNTDHVQKGQILVQLDDTDARLAVDKAEAELAGIVRQISQRFETRRQQQANLAVRQNALEQTEADLHRREQALGSLAVSKEEVEHARAARDQARAALELARAQLAAADAEVADTTVASHPAVRQAANRLRTAWLELQRCTLRTATDSQIDKRSVQIGQQVAPGTALMALVPLHQLWVEANYKEDQLKNIRIGQPVELVSDLYGSDVTYHGRVIGLSPGTGSVFSLLPAQNASGNWIKIIQRLPIRIILDADELAKHPLRVGLSMRSDINVAPSSVREMQTTPASVTEATAAAEPAEEFLAIDARIRHIIQNNLPRTSGKAA